MKKNYFLFIVLFSAFSFSQSSILLNETWHLEKLIVNGNDILPPVTINPIILTFTESTLTTNVCNSGYGEIDFSESNSFFIGDANFNVTLVMCPVESDTAFENHYLYNFFMYNVTQDFLYSQTTVEDEVEKLVITNSQNNQAVYYNQNLSSTSFKKDHLSFYPNPTKDLLYFKSEINKKSSVEIYDLLGKLCLTRTLNENKNYIDTNSLEKGFYLLKVTNEDGVSSGKFIKE